MSEERKALLKLNKYRLKDVTTINEINDNQISREDII